MPCSTVPEPRTFCRLPDRRIAARDHAGRRTRGGNRKNRGGRRENRGVSQRLRNSRTSDTNTSGCSTMTEWATPARRVMFRISEVRYVRCDRAGALRVYSVLFRRQYRTFKHASGDRAIERICGSDRADQPLAPRLGNRHAQKAASRNRAGDPRIDSPVVKPIRTPVDDHDRRVNAWSHRENIPLTQRESRRAPFGQIRRIDKAGRPTALRPLAHPGKHDPLQRRTQRGEE